jgi:carboxyl-terminal processing protease
MGKTGLAPYFLVAALLGCVLFAGGARASEQGPPAVASAYSEAPYSTAITESPLTEAIFRTVYSAIAERYLDSVAVQTLALEGLLGLTAIDPTLSISREDGLVAIASNDATIMRFAEPTPSDAKGWATLSAQIVGTARQVSKAVAATDDEQIYETVIDRALGMLDRFSRYFSPREADDHRAKRRGSGEIGIEFLLVDDGLIITNLLPGSSAGDAGLRIGDHLSKVNGVAVARLTTEQVSARLRGREGSAVIVVGKRGDQMPFRLRVQRTRSIPDTVVVRRFDDILYVAIKNFNRDTPRSLAHALQSHRHGAGRGIVLDLRGNPGGLLQQSISVADLFLTAGAIVSTRGRHPDSLQSYEAGAGDAARGIPVVVLVDGGSASGSEVVAAALAEQGRAVLVGTASYGKGTIQTVVPLPNDGELILTWSRMISPSGNMLNERGVVPALCTSGIGQTDPAQLNRLIADMIVRAIERPVAARDDCPAERHEHDVDIQIARKLLSNPDLFAKLAASRAKPPPFIHRTQLDTVDGHVMVATPVHDEPPM